jgi:hypothetical protein
MNDGALDSAFGPSGPLATAPPVQSGPEPPRSVEVRGILKGPDAAPTKR